MADDLIIKKENLTIINNQTKKIAEEIDS